MPPDFSIVNEQDIPSPALLIVKERVQANLQLMLEIAGGPERLRTHVKTHKMAPLVRMQIELGISKFKVATIAEAEMCGGAGALDVTLAYPMVGPNILRSCELVLRFPATKFSVIADSPSAIRGLCAEARNANITLDVLLDLDCGMHRTGVAPGADALALYRLIDEQPGLRPAGLHAYDGHILDADESARRTRCEADFAPVEAFRRELLSAGLPVPTLIAGGSPTFRIHASHPDRELSPGTTVLWDFGYSDRFPDLPFHCAALLLTRVVSKPAPNRLCLDLGHKALAADQPQPRVRLLEIPDAVPVIHSEEHLVVETSRAGEYHIGQCLHGIPRHVCPTVALYDEAVVVEHGEIGERWSITARRRHLTV